MKTTCSREMVRIQPTDYLGEKREKKRARGLQKKTDPKGQGWGSGERLSNQTMAVGRLKGSFLKWCIR